MDLIIATNNAHKLSELKAILSPYFGRILSLNEAGINHHTIEDGTTFYENAHKKAIEIAQLSGLPTLADDSGLTVEALGGAPGVYSARFASENATDEENVALLLSKMKDIKFKDRKAAFVCVMSLILPKGEIVGEGKVEGYITFEPAGNNGFGYDPVFYIPEYSCTFAQLDAQVKNSISHRGKAAQDLIKKLAQREDVL